MSDTTREALIEANKVVEAATDAVQQAEELVAKAKAAHEAANAAIVAAREIKHRSYLHRLASIKKASSEPTPADLLEARRENLFVGEQEEEARAVLDHLEGELASARKVLESANAKKTAIVAGVMIGEFKVIAAEIAQIYQRRKYLREVLYGVRLPSGTPQQLVYELNSLAEAAQFDAQEAQRAYPPQAKGAVAFWQRFAEALALDPEAAIGDPPAPDKLWG